MKGILGKKLGMTEVFTESGKIVPVTAIEVCPNVVMQIKTKATDGYDAVQLGFDDKKMKRANKAEQGHVKKANSVPKRFLKEIRNIDISGYKIGQEVTMDIFAKGEMVDVTGTSKGKGFQGVIKRHNQSRGPMSHGSHYHRGVGSMGPMRPMRVLPGKKLPGHMGSQTVTIQNLEIVEFYPEEQVILVKGNVPGAKGGYVVIKTAIKNPGVVNESEDLKVYDVQEKAAVTLENEEVTDTPKEEEAK